MALAYNARVQRAGVPQSHEMTDMMFAARCHDQLVNERAIPGMHGLFLLDEKLKVWAPVWAPWLPGSLSLSLRVSLANMRRGVRLSQPLAPPSGRAASHFSAPSRYGRYTQHTHTHTPTWHAPH